MFRRAVLTTLVLLWAPPALAKSPSPIGTYKAWTAYTAKEERGLTCYMASQPKESKPKGVKRGEIWVLVTHRPYKSVRNEVSFYVGYPLKLGSEAIAEIDGKKHKLFTSEETAWAASGKLDNALVRAMRKGRRMIFRGVSRRGTKTTDSYSLSGFTAAHNAISKACKAK
ncbi:MAG: invasion associated locus B family protein [Alphaproteobacteria bacterium]|jgi:invasion protein IalB|nr:invasion associated locus B family protein [Alphaproteobacteria bacterium]